MLNCTISITYYISSYHRNTQALMTELCKLKKEIAATVVVVVVGVGVGVGVGVVGAVAVAVVVVALLLVVVVAVQGMLVMCI